MANRFSGRLISDDGKALNNVNVILNSGTFSQKTVTDKEGSFNITTAQDIDPKNATLTFSKDKYTLYKIKNPQPTGAYNPSQPQIDPIYGGILSLKGGFDNGKYLISSLNPKIQEQLYWELFNISEFIKQNPKINQITIVASESTVPNYDREEFLEDGSSNTNWAGPINMFKTKSLPQKSLSDKRYQSLKIYIENFFKENGSPIPTIQSRTLVGGNEDTDRFVRLEAQLTQVNCATKNIEKDNKIQDDTILIKPPGATKITLNAFTYPDRFGINGKYNDYYTQAPNTLGSVTSWEFIVYLSLYGTSLLNDDTIVIKQFNTSDLKKTLLTDIKLNKDIKIQLVEFIKKSKKTGSTNPNLANLDNQLIIDLAIQNSVGAQSPIAYGYPIIRENTVMSLTQIGTNESFVLNQRKGVIEAPSIYSFNICDNRQ
jgi:hypothetical protein